MATMRSPSRATKTRPTSGSDRIASSARRCLAASGANSSSSSNSSPSSATSCSRSPGVAVPSAAVASDIEAEVDHVAVAHDVFLALEAQLPRLLGALLAAGGDVVVIRRDLGADEAALEIGVDHAGGLRRGGAGRYGPGAHLLRPGGEIGLQPEQVIGGADDAVQARLVHPHVLEKELLVLFRHVGDLRLDRGAHRHDGRAFLGGVASQLFKGRERTIFA